MIGNDKYVTDVETTPYEFPEKLEPNSGGLNFETMPVLIRIKLIKELKIHGIRLYNKDTNVKSYFVTLIRNNKKVDTINHQNGLKPAFVKNNEKISEIKIRILSTYDGQNPRNIEFSILAGSGCEDESESVESSESDSWSRSESGSISISMSESESGDKTKKTTRSSSRFTTPSNYHPSTTSKHQTRPTRTGSVESSGSDSWSRSESGSISISMSESESGDKTKKTKKTTTTTPCK